MSENGETVHIQDQMLAYRRDQAKLFGTYWKELRSHGVPRLMAAIAFVLYVFSFEFPGVGQIKEEEE